MHIKENIELLLIVMAIFLIALGFMGVLIERPWRTRPYEQKETPKHLREPKVKQKIYGDDLDYIITRDDAA